MTETVEVTKEIDEIKCCEEQQNEEQQQENAEEESSYHLSVDEIDEFEESQAKFRTLWEKKRDKVSESFVYHMRIQKKE
jgi:beta-lactamase superfamily II metal-dependent hydrolase